MKYSENYASVSPHTFNTRAQQRLGAHRSNALENSLLTVLFALTLLILFASSAKAQQLPDYAALVEEQSAAVVRITAIGKSEPAAAPASTQPDNTVELTFWNSIKDGTDKGLFESYLTQFPNGVFAGLARAKIDALAKQEAAAANQSDTAFFQAIQNSDNKADFEAYLSQYPNGTFASLAKARIAAIEDRARQASAAANTAANPAPQQPSIDADTAFWNQVKDAQTKSELNAYLSQFPNGKYTAIAKARIAGIEEKRRVASLTPASNGTQTFTGFLVGDGGGNFASKRFCGTDKRWPTTVTITDQTVLAKVKKGVGVTMRGNMTTQDRFRGKVIGVGGGSRYSFNGRVSEAGLELKVGGETSYCTAHFEPAN